jgi:hypothetical protein
MRTRINNVSANIAIAGLSAFPIMAFAGNGAHGNGNFSSGVTITGGSFAQSSATGGVAQTFANGVTHGDGNIQMPGANAGGKFESGFAAHSNLGSADNYGMTTSGGQSTGGVAFGVQEGHLSNSFAGADTQKSAAGTSGGTNMGSNTWNSGSLQGSAWMDRGNNHADSNAQTGNAAQDWGHKTSNSQGAGQMGGFVQFKFGH